MDNLEYKLSEYKKLRTLDENEKVHLVEKDLELFIMKIISNENIKIYNMLKNVNHKHIANVIEVFDEGESGVVIEECVSGKTIEKSLADEGLFEEKEVVQYALQMCDALEFLHKNNIIHRDITASNVIISSENTIKLIDFGISRIKRKNANSDTEILGTQNYAAPEQYGFGQSDNRTDIYSFGVLINLMLTGKFHNEELCKGIFRDIVKKCTEFLPERRYPNINRLRNAIMIKTKRKNVLSIIPGFRTNHILKKIIAIYFYLNIFAYALITILLYNEYSDLAETIDVLIFCIIIPILGITDFLYFTEKIYFIKDYKALKILLRILIPIFSFFICVMIFGIIENFF